MLRCRLVQLASHACGAGWAPAGAEPGPGWRSRKSPGVSVAGALSWAVSHAEGRVTPSIRSAFTPAIYEFATHRLLFLTTYSSSVLRNRDMLEPSTGAELRPTPSY